MASERLEIRIDRERKEHLELVAKDEERSVSDAVRLLLDRGFEEWISERRKLAVERIAAMEIEEMPDPEELARQMDSMYDVDLP